MAAALWAILRTEAPTQVVAGTAPVAPVQSPIAVAPDAVTRATPPDSSPPSPDTQDANVAQIDESDEEAFAEIQLAQLERMRAIPGAAPLVDEIVERLKNDPDGSISLDQIPVNEHGLAELDDEAIEHMIPDPELRSRWENLMALVADHVEKDQDR